MQLHAENAHNKISTRNSTKTSWNIKFVLTKQQKQLVLTNWF